MTVTEEEVKSLLSEILEQEVDGCLARKIVKRLWQVAQELGLEEGLAQIAVAWDVRREFS